MAGFRGGQRGLDRLQVAHFADEDHIGILAQRALERLAEAHRVDADLALVDDRSLVAHEELDRVLDRHDVAGLVRIDVIDHRRQRRRLTGTGRPGDENQAALLAGDLLQHLGQEQLLDRGDLEGNDAEHDADGATLLEDVHAEAAQTRNAVRQVELVLRLELLLLVIVHDAERHPRDLLGRKAARVLERHQVAVDAEHRRQASLEVDIGGAAAQRHLQDLVQLHRPSHLVNRRTTIAAAQRTPKVPSAGETCAVVRRRPPVAHPRAALRRAPIRRTGSIRRTRRAAPPRRAQCRRRAGTACSTGW